MEEKKELLAMLDELTPEERDRTVMYIKGMVDGRKIREAMEKKKETEEREGA